jgi:hypothetical protein
LNLKGRPKLRVASGAWSIFTLRRGQPALPFSPIFSHLLRDYDFLEMLAYYNSTQENRKTGQLFGKTYLLLQTPAHTAKTGGAWPARTKA